MATRPSSSDIGIPRKPAPEDFEPPVGWLLGRQLIANLKWILLYAAFKGKLDARDWMKAEVIPDRDTADQVEQYWKEWQEARQGSAGAEPFEEFWFDYMADTGDGQRAMYSTAYLSLSDLAVGENPRPGDRVEFVHQPDRARLKAEGKMLLPRGTFLFVGGDTSYHISDYGTLATRFQNPFWWAFRDLKDKAARSVTAGRPGLLVGIPGNHDYYDSLDGFNRQFRRPSTEDKIVPGERPPLLMIPTFKRQQEASFLALRLPFDWWLWGLDTEEGEIDFRQLEFFKGLHEKHAPRRLIVATPEPSTVFGKFAKRKENQSKTFKAIGLELPFLEQPEPLGEGKCRLDLAGDVHHYARHWGEPPASRRASRYVSIVSGGGGAFFHPSHTNVGEVPRQVLYPADGDSRSAVADQIFNLLNIVRGGWVWLFGGLIAFMLYFAASFPASSRAALDTHPLWVKLGISPPREAASPTYWQLLLNLVWGPNAPWKYSLLASIVVLGAALIYSARIFAKEYDPERVTPKRKVPLWKRLVVWGLVLVSFLCLAGGLWGFYSRAGELSLYGRSAIVLAALAWSVLAVVESVWYSEWLFELSAEENIKPWHYWPIWALLFLAVTGFSAALWFFGHSAALVASDLVNLFILLAVGGGLVFLAAGVGAHLRKIPGKLAFALLGASHGLLQLAVPFLIVRKGHLVWAPVAVAATAFAFKYLGRWVARRESGWPLAIAWVAFGAALLYIPFVVDADPLNMPEGHWARLLLCVYAGVIGAVMSCVLFGWYLAVSLAFNGHNNEAGGAARIEGFKQFIRFRVTRQELTGYVIAVDEAQTDGGKLDPKIIDVFRVSEQGNG
ncbi:MAG: hypothetical protein M3416_04600 [Acidobacteriota bacterium]|nr:hypothetical protein [Acidobacteriota bacterium]